MSVRVYHADYAEALDRWTEGELLGQGPGPLLRLAAQGETVGVLREVAAVETDDLELAMKLTNTIWRDWQENGGVTLLRDGAGPQRSTSVGDVLVDANGHGWHVARLGFNRLSDELTAALLAQVEARITARLAEAAWEQEPLDGPPSLS